MIFCLLHGRWYAHADRWSHPEADRLAIIQAWGDREYQRALWAEIRPVELPTWIAEQPGTRPDAWWRFSAPRWQPTDLPARLRYLAEHGHLDRYAEPRRRLGGIGTPKHEALANIPEFDRGVPIRWVTEWDVSDYNGRARDVHGQRIGTEYAEGHFPFSAIDSNDPPLFESEAAYLRRHGLLADDESAHLNPDAFEPVSVCADAEGL